ncbi:MAG: hypothetical protein JWN24_1325 [Phycisphaerales bacterium]|nr:hypothetical protein [Phycisphaerales bacterium]
MKKQAKKWLTFTLRWGIAVAGIVWVLAKTPFRDQLTLLEPGNKLVQARVLHDPPESSQSFEIIDPNTRKPRFVPRNEVWTQPDGRSIRLREPSGPAKKAKLLAIRPGDRLAVGESPAELLVLPADSHDPQRITPDRILGGYKIEGVPYPLVNIGIDRLVKNANLAYLLAALMVLPISYLITSRRWHLLLHALDIHLTQSRTFVLNMVGAFYNSFMPGSTGGDVAKAYYAAQHTTHKVRAVLSVLVDRVIGLLALIILGGVMAAVQWQVRDCRKVAIVCAAIIGATVAGLIVFYHPVWRRGTGLDWLLKRMPMQKQVHHAVEAMELYGRRPKAALTALIMTFPVHVTTIVSAIFAGYAFGISGPNGQGMSLLYYCTVVPVVTLVGAIPISPQGAGVMEAFAILLTKGHGVTVSQAIALAMAIRFVQMFWNLTAGVFTLRGGFHAPTEKEQETMETDEDEASGVGVAGSVNGDTKSEIRMQRSTKDTKEDTNKHEGDLRMPICDLRLKGEGG